VGIRQAAQVSETSNSVLTLFTVVVNFGDQRLVPITVLPLTRLCTNRRATAHHFGVGSQFWELRSAGTPSKNRTSIHLEPRKRQNGPICIPADLAIGVHEFQEIMASGDHQLLLVEGVRTRDGSTSAVLRPLSRRYGAPEDILKTACMDRGL
jgi:hypothetical protein